MKDNFKNLSVAELKVKKDELAKKYLNHRFQRVIGHVENPVESRTLRRKIARLNTLLGQKGPERPKNRAQRAGKWRSWQRPKNRAGVGGRKNKWRVLWLNW